MNALLAITFVTSLAAGADCVPPFEVVATGKPVYRRPGLLPEILENRLSAGKITAGQVRAARAFIAVNDCSLIGAELGVSFPGMPPIYPALVVDCKQQDLPRDHGPWVLAAEFEQDTWEQHYSWAQFMRREAIRVWRDLTDSQLRCIF